MVAGNTKIGEFELSGFPEKPAGEVKVKVTFKISKEGLLDVEACEADNVTNRKSAKIDLQNFKFPTIEE